MSGMSERKTWIGVDLDGTLAHYDGWRGFKHIGEPIEPMLLRVKQMLAEGKDVRIFTARVADHKTFAVELPLFEQEVRYREWWIQRWCQKHLDKVLPVTCTKDFAMAELWDDRAVAVQHGTGAAAAFKESGLHISTGIEGRPETVHCHTYREWQANYTYFSPESVSREDLGIWVRDAWVTWAKQQPNPQPSWIKPWEELGEGMKEVDRQIGEHIVNQLRKRSLSGE